MKKIRLMITTLLMVLSVSAMAQNIRVHGVVTDGATGEPIPYTSIQLKGTSQGTSTDADGRYQIIAPQSGTLVFVFIGYENQEVAIKNRGEINVAMVPDALALDQAVVTAMGITRSEKSLGYSATTMKSEDLTVARNTDVTASLQGKVAGVQVQATSGDPGAATNVIIRGYGSINGSNQPLYVVDGVPLQNNTLSTQGHSIALNGISNIASDDIESMTILKGAAATALYGSRASNGVVVITTKSGRQGLRRDFQISYNGGMQFRQISYLPEMQNMFGQGWNGAQTWIENGSWGPKLDGSMQVYGPIWNGQQLIHKYQALENNVRDFFDTGVSHNHAVSLSGATNNNRMTYYMSYTHTSDNGIMPSDADTYKRNTISFRSTYNAAKWLKLSTSINFANSSTDMVGSFQGTSVIDGIFEMPRDVSIVDMKDLTNPFNTPEAYFTPYGITNPYWSLANNKNHTDSKQIYGKVQVDIKPIPELTISYRSGFDYTDYDRKSGFPQISLDDALIDDDKGYAPSNMNQNGWVAASYRRAYELNNDILVSYDDKYFNDKMTLTANVGININERASTSISGETEKLTINTGFWDLSNGANKTVLSESQSMRRLIGLFADVTLGYDDMIFLNITGRNDWSSTLPINKNNYFYPGATLSWLFTELIPKNNVLSFGKVRVAYGMTGADAGVYMINPAFTQAYAKGYYFSDIAKFPMQGQNSYITTNTLGSSTLKPEMTREFEVGLNLQFFNGRLGLDAAYYNKITSDQIFTLPVDPSTGYSYMVTNFGEVQNQGYELMLNTTPVKAGDFRWDVDFTFSQNFNKVLSMPESLEGGMVNIYSFSAGDDAVYMRAEAGKPMGTYYTYLPQYVKEGPYAGCPIVDENGQPVKGTVVEDTGMTMNNLWVGGINTKFSWRGISLSAVLDARVGGHMFSRTKNLMQFTGNGIETIYNDRNPFVIPNSVVSDGNGGYVPNTVPINNVDGSYQTYFDTYGWGNCGLAYMVDRSFVKLRNITLAWDLPKKWLKPIYLSGLSLSAFVNNPFMWTAADNVYCDPESTTTGNDLAGQFGELYTNPSCRVFGFNVGIKF